MKHLLFYLALCAMFATSCNTENELQIANGHWHLIEYQDSTFTSQIDEVQLNVVNTFDVRFLFRNRIVVEGKLTKGAGGKQVLHYPDNGLWDSLQVVSSADTTFVLKSFVGERYFKLHPYQVDLLHRTQDYLGDSRIEVDLFRNYCDSSFNRSTTDLEIIIGKNLRKEAPRFVMSVDGTLVDYLDPIAIAAIIEQKKIGLTLTKRKKITPVLYAHQDAPREHQIKQAFLAMGFKELKQVYIEIGRGEFDLGYRKNRYWKNDLPSIRVVHPEQLMDQIFAEEVQTSFSRYETDGFNLPNQYRLGSYVLHLPDTHMSIGRYDEVIVGQDTNNEEWNTSTDQQRFVQLKISTYSMRLWNGMGVGDKIKGYEAYINFNKTNAPNVISYTDTGFKYDITLADDKIVGIVTTDLDFVRSK